MRQVVLDASVIIKWFKIENEPDWKQANELYIRQLQGVIDINVPSILYYELFNTLIPIVKINSSRITKVLNNAELTITPIDDREFIDLASNLMRKKEISFYDASYVALAKLLNAKLITADTKLIKKVKESYVIPLSSTNDFIIKI